MEGGQRSNDVPALALNLELAAFVWRILDDSSHALHEGTGAGNGSDDLGEEGIVVVTKNSPGGMTCWAAHSLCHSHGLNASIC